jgi:hypothetical protein
VVGGLEVSHGFLLPDLNQMGQTVLELEVTLSAQDQAFMVEAGWQFIYTIEAGSENIVREHDRDFGNTVVVTDLRDVFERWWPLLKEDLR